MMIFYLYLYMKHISFKSGILNIAIKYCEEYYDANENETNTIYYWYLFKLNFCADGVVIFAVVAFDSFIC